MAVIRCCELCEAVRVLKRIRMADSNKWICKRCCKKHGKAWPDDSDTSEKNRGQLTI